MEQMILASACVGTDVTAVWFLWVVVGAFFLIGSACVWAGVQFPEWEARQLRWIREDGRPLGTHWTGMLVLGGTCWAAAAALAVVTISGLLT
jgi:hypothetical protein